MILLTDSSGKNVQHALILTSQGVIKQPLNGQPTHFKAKLLQADPDKNLPAETLASIHRISSNKVTIVTSRARVLVINPTDLSLIKTITTLNADSDRFVADESYLDNKGNLHLPVKPQTSHCYDQANSKVLNTHVDIVVVQSAQLR